MIDKALLTGAFEKMGPERVERMLLAFGPGGDQLSYCRCALGYAAGFEKQTVQELSTEMLATGICRVDAASILPWFARRLNITTEQAEEIEDCHIFSSMRGGFVALANEWLENRPASLRAASGETADVGACRFGRDS